MGKLDPTYELHLQNAYWHYYNKSTIEPFFIDTTNFSLDAGFYEMQQESNNALRFLESNGYIEQLVINEKYQSYKITQKGLDYFASPQTAIQNVTTIHQGNQSSTIIGNSNILNTSICGDVFIDIQSSELDNEHKILLTKLFAEISNTENKISIKDKIKNFVYDITTGVVTDSAKAALVFAISKSLGL